MRVQQLSMEVTQQPTDGRLLCDAEVVMPGELRFACQGAPHRLLVDGLSMRIAYPGSEPADPGRPINVEAVFQLVALDGQVTLALDHVRIQGIHFPAHRVEAKTRGRTQTRRWTP